MLVAENVMFRLLPMHDSIAGPGVSDVVNGEI